MGQTAQDLDFDELEGLLDEAQDEAVETEANHEPVKITVSDKSEDTAALLDDVDEEVSLQSEEEAELAEEAAKSVVVETKAKKKTGTRKASVGFSAGMTFADFAAKTLDDSTSLLLETGDTDPEAAIAAFEAVKKPVKVRDKLANLISWYAGKKSLSTYTAATMKAIIAKGSMTKADIRNNLLDCGVQIGTASSQAGQMTHVLEVGKIATYDGKQFNLNPDSILVALFESRSEEAEEE